MQKTNVFLLDFTAGSGLGSALREILELNSAPPFYLQEESAGSSGFDAFVLNLSTIVQHLNPSIIFKHSPQAKKGIDRFKALR